MMIGNSLSYALPCRALLAVTLSLMPATPLLAQRLGQGPTDTDFSLWRVFAAILFLAILAAIAFALTKARGRPLQIFKPAEDRKIEIVEVARISTQASLCLARFNGSEYLIAVTQNGATLVEKHPITPNPTESSN